MFNDPDDKPFEMKSQEPQDIGDNTPILVPSDEPVRSAAPTLPAVPSSKGNTGIWILITVLTLIGGCLVSLFVFSVFVPVYWTDSPTQTPALTIRTTDLTATQRAWVRPDTSPSLGTAEEAQQANDSGNVRTLQNRATIQPDIPEINMPGDVYIYELNISADLPNLWRYSWCAVDESTLFSNVSQMKVEFLLNGVKVDQAQVATENYVRSDDEGYCQSFTVLIKDWPEGDHQLETRVTFIEPTHDGWNLYPAGTHVFKFFAYVNY